MEEEAVAWFLWHKRNRSRRGQVSYPQAHAGPLSLQTQSQGTEPEHSTGLRLLLYQYQKPYHHGCPNTENEALLEDSSKVTGGQRRVPTLSKLQGSSCCVPWHLNTKGERKKCHRIHESIGRVSWRHSLSPARATSDSLICICSIVDFILFLFFNLLVRDLLVFMSVSSRLVKKLSRETNKTKSK